MNAPMKPLGVEAAVRTLIRRAGDDPRREGLADTLTRVARACRELFGGCDEMVLPRGMRLESHGEHPMVPIVGVAHVADLPRRRVVGISKLARVVDIFARRPQIQERLTAAIASVVQEVLQPHGVAVMIAAEHHCMTTRGIHKPGVGMVTTRLLGRFREDAKTRREFLAAVQG